MIPLRRQRRSDRRGLSMAELVVSSALIGLLMVAALQAAGQSLLAQRLAAHQTWGAALANTLLSEIRSLPYAEPGTTEPAIGIDASESLADRTTLDDVDDYHGYSESPPRRADGAGLANLSGWSRTVTVEWVDPATLNPPATTSGAKRVTVTAAFNGATVYTATGYRTSAP